MAKYQYDRSALKGLGVGAFLGEVKLRERHIAAAPDTMPQSVFQANRVAQKLHPHVQFAKVARVIDRVNARSYVLVPNEAWGTKALAYFRAGQYVSLALTMDGVTANRPYTICSSPKDALGEKDTSYTLTVKKAGEGHAGDYILDHFTEGTEIIMSGPLGNFYYQSLRDSDHIVALAGGSGITPFYSMACAIADGIENFTLTILYGSRTRQNILLEQELNEVAARSNGKVRVVNVLSDEAAEGYEQGFITADLIRRYTAGDFSVFVCGPGAMYAYLEQELPKLGLPKRRIRFEVGGEFGDPARDSAYPQGQAQGQYTVTVHIRGEVKTVTCGAKKSLLRVMEEAGIRVPSDCRSGKCGWCHSRLISGDVFVPEKADGRRMADKKFGWIHPCCTYPLSDVELEIFPMLE